jgi:hypothetical protein
VQVLLQVLLGVAHPDAELLQPTWRSDHPPGVAEVTLDLTGDGRCREPSERLSQPGAEAADRLDQSEPGDLDEVVAVDAPAEVTTGDAVGEPEVEQDQCLGGGAVDRPTLLGVLE